MPWENNSSNNPGSPWGSKGGGGPRKPPGSGEIDEMLRKIKDMLPRRAGGGMSGIGIALILVVIVLLWLISGFYRVLPDEQGVELRFGKFVERTGPGLNYHLPFPIESVYTPKVTVVNEVQIGFVKDVDRLGNRVLDRPEESLMLTGDENIVDIDFVVFWVIRDAPDFIFNVQNPIGTVKAVAESSMREVIGRRSLQPILTIERNEIELAVQKLMQDALDNYGAGISIQKVQMDKVDPPAQVIGAFRDVQAAKADQERLQNEAQAYANKVIPEARGESAKIVQAAQAYKEQIVSEAEGMADRFNSVYNEYKKAPQVTRQRIYIETMEEILSDRDKIIIENSADGQAVFPYLPLEALKK